MDEQTRQEIRQGFADGTYHNPGYGLPCPNCGKSTTIFEQGSQWYCWNCDLEFEQKDTEPYYDVLAYEADLRIPEELLEYMEEGGQNADTC